MISGGTSRLLSTAVAVCLVFVSTLAQRGFFNVTAEDFLHQTRFIFVGTLIEKESYRSEDGRFILTRHRFEVLDAIKGDPGDRITITEYGGTVGDITMEVSHSPRYAAGQEYMVFSYVDPGNHDRTFAGPLGQLRVIADRSGSRAVRIYPGHPLARLLGAGAGGLQRLEAFSVELRQAAAGREPR